ncbi:hypothetical protein TSH100_04040 [Azospirillum sp. TSH100]|uniref:hypothetical protein n=1 Tax=Azospirillum sp. TSH100 TaxID=652764 RepID=UPI000D617676|nr:hypothetical protein [Azospirillum sp. TSH100]PWC89817.1 hypothetical protein TSH100_04040 [Azospirillum sp. TSH100]QCG92357.1 hypothetical protein E6C72_31630 [Azospirillum sp. TSH100]
MADPVKKRRGRPAVHLDQADRQAAYRERQANAQALGEVARQALDRPTPAFLKRLIARALDQADDPEALRADLADHLKGLTTKLVP